MDSDSARAAWLKDEQEYRDAGWIEQAQLARYFAAVAVCEPRPSQHAPEHLQRGLRELDKPS